MYCIADAVVAVVSARAHTTAAFTAFTALAVRARKDMDTPLVPGKTEPPQRQTLWRQARLADELDDW